MANPEKNYISIGVLARTTKSVACNNGIGVRQKSKPQSNFMQFRMLLSSINASSDNRKHKT